MVTNRKLIKIGIVVFALNGIVLAQVAIIELRSRKAQKYMKQMKQDSIPIPVDLKDRVGELLGSRVSLTGCYDHASEMYLCPRYFITEHMEATPYKENHIGINVITPFYCNELKSSVLINRGWIPKQLRDPSTREEGQIEGDIPLIGVVTQPPKVIKQTKQNKPDLNKWEYIDVENMAIMHNTEPILLDCSYEASTPGGPIGGQHDFGISKDPKDYFGHWYAYISTGGLVLYLSYCVFMFFGRRARFHYKSSTITAKDSR
ncbi:Surfeit locus protein 1-like [Oopsacas minuta]|uniref:SURF1-like protein n=1 Tax=Oopsacas minuta TaxID=111878 RepID=A0AAV7JYC1_9METZ|nr:Surfeit locus protein 1-like [Oopsacas minuta]